MNEIKESHNVYKIALLVSIACILQIAESLIPHPIPGLRLGLANVITLIALVIMGFGYAMEITILRTILGSFLMGTFMSPTFILSFSGGVISTLIMGFFLWLSRGHKPIRFSIVGISIVGALTHNIVQLYLAYLILVKHPGIFIFFPWLCIGAVIMGWVTGIVAGQVCLNLKERKRPDGESAEVTRADCSSLGFQQYLPGHSVIHRLPAEIKIVCLVILSLAMLTFNNLSLYLGLSFLLIMIFIASQTPPGFLLMRARKYASMMFASFLFPLFFNSNGHVLSQLAYLKITAEGLNTGAILSLRILFLALLSSVLARTTSPQDLAQGLAKALSPLRILGISGKRIAAIFSLSWMAIPVFLGVSKTILRSLDFKKAKNISRLISLLSDFITRFYLETEQMAIRWEDSRLVQEKDLVYKNLIEPKAVQLSS